MTTDYEAPEPPLAERPDDLAELIEDAGLPAVSAAVIVQLALTDEWSRDDALELMARNPDATVTALADCFARWANSPLSLAFTEATADRIKQIANGAKEAVAT